jgi:Uma2 family endonuclease
MASRTVSLSRPRLLSMEEWVRNPAADQYELIDGVLRPRMVNQNEHEFAVGRLAYIFNDYLIHSDLRGAVFTSNTKYQVRSRRGIMPDLSVVLEPRLQEMKPEAAYNLLGPDLAVEVLSPDQDDDYVDERLGDFWKIGTSEVWMVDLRTEVVAGYTRGEHHFEVFATSRDSEPFSSRLLEGLTFPIASLWMRRR